MNKYVAIAKAVELVDLLDILLLLCYVHAFIRPVTRERHTIRTIALTLALFQLKGDLSKGTVIFFKLELNSDNLHWGNPHSVDSGC